MPDLTQLGDLPPDIPPEDREKIQKTIDKLVDQEQARRKEQRHGKSADAAMRAIFNKVALNLKPKPLKGPHTRCPACDGVGRLNLTTSSGGKFSRRCKHCRGKGEIQS